MMVARLLWRCFVHAAEHRGSLQSGDEQRVLRHCRAAETTGGRLVAPLGANSRSTPVVRYRTVGSTATLPALHTTKDLLKIDYQLEPPSAAAPPAVTWRPYTSVVFVWINGLVVSTLGIRARWPGFESWVAPLFHWVATLGKLFTHTVSPVSQLQETGVQKGGFGAQVVMVVKCARLS